MAVHAQFGCFAGCLPGVGGSFAEEQLFADGAALLSFAASNRYHCPGVVVSGAQSELTCNGSGGGVLPSSSRKRGRVPDYHPDEQYQYVTTSSSLPAVLPPIPALMSRAVDSVAASTSGRACGAAGLSSADVPVLLGAEVDAVVRAEWARLRAGLEHARKRQRQELARSVVGAAARVLRETEARLAAAHRRAAELEERLRQAAAKSQAWCALALGHEAAAAELHAALEHHLLLLSRGGIPAAPADVAEEGFGESDGKLFFSSAAANDDDDAQSCCFEDKSPAAAGGASSNSRWACKACGEREASVLLLPCRHLCLCKACDPRTDACPVCFAVKNASIHVAEK